MRFDRPWIWVLSLTTTAAFAAAALLSLLAVADEVAAEAHLSAGENAAVVALLTAVSGVAPGILVLLVCARIARRRSKTR